MSYYPHLYWRLGYLCDYLDVRKEQGHDTDDVAKELEQLIERSIQKMEDAAFPASLLEKEPLALSEIQAKRPAGPRQLPLPIGDDALYDKMQGAWLGRAAGCMLGVPVESWSMEEIRLWAEEYGQTFPLTDYFKFARNPWALHYGVDPIRNFLKDNVSHVGPDDDLAYTILGLLILEEAGIDFTSEDVGRLWVKYLPIACTAEDVALRSLKDGVKPPTTAMKNNPYQEWIGADIRSDPWGYAAPGLPEVAAELAYRDASVSHVLNGVYGAMFFSAAIAAAFALNDVEEIIQVALTEIPADCRLSVAVRQTLDWCKEDGDWEKTYRRIDEAYKGMHRVHTINNAALTIAGLAYGGGDFEKTIGTTVGMGYDCDCTSATAGSIVGAMLGKSKLPSKWIAPLGDDVLTYLTGVQGLKSSDLARRFVRVAQQVRARYAGSQRMGA